jgi:hypothetical protein
MNYLDHFSFGVANVKRSFAYQEFKEWQKQHASVSSR